MSDRAPSQATATQPSHNGSDSGPPGASPPDPMQQLTISGVVLDRTQLLAAVRATLPNATGIAPIDNGAYYAILMTPAPGPTLSPLSSS